MKVVVDHLQLLPPPPRPHAADRYVAFIVNIHLHLREVKSSRAKPDFICASHSRRPDGLRVGVQSAADADKLRVLLPLVLLLCSAKESRWERGRREGERGRREGERGRREGERGRRKCQSSREILGRKKMKLRQLGKNAEAAAGFLGRL